MLRGRRVGDGGRAQRALVVECKACDEGVRHLHRADRALVRYSGAAVDEDIVIIVNRPLASMRQKASSPFRVEFPPFERAPPDRIGIILTAGADQIDAPLSEVEVY